ncbi:MAG: S9 family peptidase, partial [Hyphococcus sp.]
MSIRTPFERAATTPAPKIEKRPFRMEQHGQARNDDYHWLRAENWQEVLRDPSTLPDDIRDVLTSENAFYEAATDGLEPLRRTLFAEMRGRIKEDDASVPHKDGGWLYWRRFREGGEYPVYLRKRLSGDADEIVFDGDAERGDSEFFDIGAVAHSPDHRLAAIAVDRLGSEYFTITVRDLETGQTLGDVIESADDSGAVWAADSRSFFYVERDDNQRPKRVKLHRLGADPKEDAVVYEEPDDGY